jgi:hypothetical protein
VPEVSVTGERSLFFTHRTNEERWRLSEKVAAVLEGNFVGEPGSVFTFSTASIPNGTPYPPPLDVVFSASPDPLAAFSFVQVKDHAENKVKREYIDAVIGQRVQTGIQSCAVVSTTGFTAPALELARVQNVRLRVLQTEAKWPYPGYLPPALGIHLVPRLQLQAAVLVVIGPRGTGKLSLEGEDLLRPVLDTEGIPSSVNDVFNRSLATGGRREQVESQIEANPGLAVVNVSQEFKGSKVFVHTPDGTHLIGGAAYHALVLRPEALESAITRRYLYYDPLSKTDIAWCAMADFQMSSVHDYGLEDALYHFCLWRFPSGESDSVGGAFFPA